MIAQIITNQVNHKDFNVYAKELANYFAEDNPRFDKEKFLKACGF